MELVDWLVIASLVVSLFVVISQVGVIRRLRDVAALQELLMLEAVLRAEIETRWGQEEDDNYGR